LFKNEFFQKKRMDLKLPYAQTVDKTLLLQGFINSLKGL